MKKISKRVCPVYASAKAGSYREKRRAPRYKLFLPVSVLCSDGTVEGYTENIGSHGALIQSLKGMPALGERCRIEFFLENRVEAQANVIRVDPELKRFAVEIDQFVENGTFLLAFLLSASIT